MRCEMNCPMVWIVFRYLPEHDPDFPEYLAHRDPGAS